MTNLVSLLWVTKTWHPLSKAGNPSFGRHSFENRRKTLNPLPKEKKKINLLGYKKSYLEFQDSQGLTETHHQPQVKGPLRTSILILFFKATINLKSWKKPQDDKDIFLFNSSSASLAQNKMHQTNKAQNLKRK